MSCLEFVVNAFVAFEEAGESFVLANRVQLIAASRQDFMHVSLMPHVPDELIFWRVKGVMQRDGQFDCAETCACMPADFGERFDHIRTGFGGDLRELFGFEFAQVFRVVNLFE